MHFTKSPCKFSIHKWRFSKHSKNNTHRKNYSRSDCLEGEPLKVNMINDDWFWHSSQWHTPPLPTLTTSPQASLAVRATIQSRICSQFVDNKTAGWQSQVTQSYYKEYQIKQWMCSTINMAFKSKYTHVKS